MMKLSVETSNEWGGCPIPIIVFGLGIETDPGIHLVFGLFGFVVIIKLSW